MSDLTLVLGPEWSRFSKRINAVDDITAGDQLPKFLEFDEADVTGVDDLFDILNLLRAQQNTCVIRGQLLPGVEQPCRRLLMARTEDGVHYPATFEDVPRAWLMVDFDSVPEPDGVDFVTAPAKCAEYLRAQLPRPFHTARCVWQATGSAGLKPGIRLHLWFLLDRALTGDECKAWLSHGALPFDRTVFGAVQPHFTADPVFADGVTDPMVERIGQLPGRDERVQVPTELPKDKQTKTAAKRVLAGVSDSRDMDPFVRMALARWDADNPWEGGDPDLSERFECPACGSSDGCAVLPDGKLFCHGNKHSMNAPEIGHPANNGYVMHRFEAFEKVGWSRVPARLQELGYMPGAPTKKSRPRNPLEENRQTSETIQDTHVVTELDDEQAADVEAAVDALSAAVEGREPATVKAAKKARKELSEAARCIATDPSQAEDLAYDFARVHSGTFAPSAIAKALIRGARCFDEEVEHAIERGIKRAVAEPREERTSALSLDMYGKPERCLANTVKLLHLPDFTDTLAWDERARQVVLTACPPWLAEDERETYPRPLRDTDVSAIAVYLADRLEYPKASASDIRAGLALAAMGTCFDPVVEYLDGLPAWEGSLDEAREACGAWLPMFAGADDDEYTRAVGTRWLVAAVARAYAPGCKQREVLTLLGPQNVGKSMLLQTLCGAQWFKDDLNLRRHPEMALLGHWIVELAEIDKLTAQDKHGDLKAFISTSVDKYVAPYGHHFDVVERRSLFCATANPSHIFRDMTGNTRFNVVHVGTEIDVAGLAEARDELWSAARMLFKAGEPWWLQANEKPLAAERQEAARERWDGEEYIRDLLEQPWQPRPGDVGGFRPLPGQLDPEKRLLWVTTEQLDEHLRSKDIRSGIHRQIAQAMRVIGWTSAKHVGARNRRGYLRP